MTLIYRTLEEDELPDIWRIDRSEVIEKMYYFEQGRLVLKAEQHNMTGWPPNEVDDQARRLQDCFEHDGNFFGAFSNNELVGLAVLESRFIGLAEDQLQLKFLHVSRVHRGVGVGRTLFQQSADRARTLGARGLYISATPSEHTIHFYQTLGCRLASRVEPSLYALEPDDIHLLLPL